MYIAENDDNPIYNVIGHTLFDLADDLAADLGLDGYDHYVEAMQIPDAADVTEEYKAAMQEEIDEQTIKELAAAVWNTEPANISLEQDITPYTSGKLEAVMRHLGLNAHELPHLLGEPVEKVERWVSNKDRIPIRIAVKMNELIYLQDEQVLKIADNHTGIIPVAYPRNASEQSLDVPLGWEQRIMQRLAVEHNAFICHGQVAVQQA